MKRSWREKLQKMVSMFLAVAMVVVLCTPAQAAAPAKIESDITSVTLEVGDEAQLTLSGWYKWTHWSSEDETIVTVAEYGQTKALRVGTTTVRGELVLLGGLFHHTTEFKMTVVPSTKETVRVKVGETTKLPMDQGRYTFCLTTDEEVAAVDNRGNVTGVKEGEAIVSTVVQKSRYSQLVRWGNVAVQLAKDYDISVFQLYTLAFQSNGGSDIAAQNIETGMTAAEPEPPTKEGFEFGGWYTDAELTQPYDFSTPVTQNVTLYAKWKDSYGPGEYPDHDDDKVDDRLEEILGSDPQKDDTDEDGLSDFVEAVKTRTDPVKADSDGNGVTDDAEDLDKDGLTNLEELQFDCDPRNPDTDADTLLDGDEVKRGTDPRKADTDCDGIDDPIEIAKGLDTL